jgi:hypothetical protein
MAATGFSTLHVTVQRVYAIAWERRGRELERALA